MLGTCEVVNVFTHLCVHFWPESPVAQHALTVLHTPCPQDAAATRKRKLQEAQERAVLQEFLAMFRKLSEAAIESAGQKLSGRLPQPGDSISQLSVGGGLQPVGGLMGPAAAMQGLGLQQLQQLQALLLPQAPPLMVPQGLVLPPRPPGPSGVPGEGGWLASQWAGSTCGTVIP